MANPVDRRILSPLRKVQGLGHYRQVLTTNRRDAIFSSSTSGLPLAHLACAPLLRSIRRCHDPNRAAFLFPPPTKMEPASPAAAMRPCEGKLRRLARHAAHRRRGRLERRNRARDRHAPGGACTLESALLRV